MDCIEANRNIEPLRREFDLRLYRWAEEDLSREIDSGFRWVKKVKSDRAFHYLEFLTSLPPRERANAAFAVLRSSIAHRKARTQLGLELTEAEQGYVAEYNKHFYPISLLSEHEKLLQDQSSPEEFEIDRGSFEEVLKTQLSHALGQPPKRHRACSFIQQIKGWFVETAVDVHSIYQLRYGHTIVARNSDDLCPVQLREGSVSFLGWLGVDPSTTFTMLRNVDLSATAEFMVEVTHHFLAALPPLLNGLENRIPAELTTNRVPAAKRTPV